jgi:hypothetical protein
LFDVTQSLLFRVVLTLLLAGLLLAPSSLQAQDDHLQFGVERMVYDVAPYLLNIREVQETLQASSITYLQAAARTIELGSVTLRVLEPPPWTNAESEQNNSSIGLVVEYGEFKVLLSGSEIRDRRTQHTQPGQSLFAHPG